MKRDELARCFDEWIRQYSEDPSKFEPLLDADGKPIANYGDRCVKTLERISGEIGVDIGLAPVNP